MFLESAKSYTVEVSTLYLDPSSSLCDLKSCHFMFSSLPSLEGDRLGLFLPGSCFFCFQGSKDKTGSSLVRQLCAMVRLDRCRFPSQQTQACFPRACLASFSGLTLPPLRGVVLSQDTELLSTSYTFLPWPCNVMSSVMVPDRY